jgi:hypothetical protein
MEPIFVNKSLTVALREGAEATAATTTKPAASEYSIKSWPDVSIRNRLQIDWAKAGIVTLKILRV